MKDRTETLFEALLLVGAGAAALAAVMAVAVVVALAFQVVTGAPEDKPQTTCTDFMRNLT